MPSMCLSIQFFGDADFEIAFLNKKLLRTNEAVASKTFCRVHLECNIMEGTTPQC
jgi:hypothetical protein